MEIVNSIISLFGFIQQQLGFIVCLQTLAIIYLIKRQSRLEHTYNQHDKLLFGHALIIANKLKVKTIKVHRSSDYEVSQPINHLD